MPVLAASRPSTEVPTNSPASVPVRPATGSPAATGLPAECWRTASIAAQVVRSSRLSPEPSIGRTPSIGTPHDRSRWVDRVEPRRPCPLARCGEPDLLEQHLGGVVVAGGRASRRPPPRAVADWIEAISAAAGSATPTPKSPLTRMPRAWSSRTSSRAAASFGIGLHGRSPECRGNRSPSARRTGRLRHRDALAPACRPSTRRRSGFRRRAPNR